MIVLPANGTFKDKSPNTSTSTNSTTNSFSEASSKTSNSKTDEEKKSTKKLKIANVNELRDDELVGVEEVDADDEDEYENGQPARRVEKVVKFSTQFVERNSAVDDEDVDEDEEVIVKNISNEEEEEEDGDSVDRLTLGDDDDDDVDENEAKDQITLEYIEDETGKQRKPSTAIINIEDSSKSSPSNNNIPLFKKPADLSASPTIINNYLHKSPPNVTQQQQHHYHNHHHHQQQPQDSSDDDDEVKDYFSFKENFDEVSHV